MADVTMSPEALAEMVARQVQATVAQMMNQPLTGQHMADTVDTRSYQRAAGQGKCSSWKRAREVHVETGTGREKETVAVIVNQPSIACRAAAQPGGSLCDAHARSGAYTEATGNAKPAVMVIHLEELDVAGMRLMAKAAGLIVMERKDVPATAVQVPAGAK